MIIAAGESLIDMLPVDQGGKRLFLPAPGGSPYNVSMALGRLGVPVQFLCRLSEDPFGKLLARTLEESRVDLSLCPRTPALTTLGFVMLDGPKRDPSYVFYTDNTAGCALEPGDIPQHLAPEVRCLHFDSFSLAANPIGLALEKLLSLKMAQVMFSLDPNIRPFLVRSREEFLPRLERFLRAADLLKLSEEDLAWMHPGLSVKDCCRQYIALGIGLVVVTCGAKGAVGMNARGAVEVPAERVSVADTVGAGDTFQAALLAWMRWKHGLQAEALKTLDARELEDLLSFAAKAAAITCSRSGCNPLWQHELSKEMANWASAHAQATGSRLPEQAESPSNG
jgi:fructokinase